MRPRVPAIALTPEAPPWRDRRYLLSTLVMALTIVALIPVRGTFGILNLLLIFLFVSGGVALAWGAGPAAWSAIIGFLAFDFFFIPNYHSFTVARSEHVVVLLAYLLVAIVIGQLVARVRARTAIAERERERMALLYEMSTGLTVPTTFDEILQEIANAPVTSLGASWSRATTVAGAEAMASDANPPPSADSTVPLRVPMHAGAREIGLLEVLPAAGTDQFPEGTATLLRTYAGQAALALERARLSEEASHAAVISKSDELKSALLAAVSHDLRTPLASIKASSSALLDNTVQWDPAASHDLLEAIDEEADRLTRMVSNLLDLSRVEGGAIRPSCEWNDLGELIQEVVARVEPRAADCRFTSTIAADLPLAWFDYVEIAQVVENLLDNAIRHAPPHSAISITADASDGLIRCAVANAGPPIPRDALNTLFLPFRSGDVASAGTLGIGLAICRGFVEAHGGSIEAFSPPDGGATFRFILPIAPPVEQLSMPGGQSA